MENYKEARKEVKNHTARNRTKNDRRYSKRWKKAEWVREKTGVDDIIVEVKKKNSQHIHGLNDDEWVKLLTFI